MGRSGFFGAFFSLGIESFTLGFAAGLGEAARAGAALREDCGEVALKLAPRLGCWTGSCGLRCGFFSCVRGCGCFWVWERGGLCGFCGWAAEVLPSAGLRAGDLVAEDCFAALACCDLEELSLLERGFTVLGRVFSFCAGLAAGCEPASLEAVADAGLVDADLGADACFPRSLDWTSLLERACGLPCGVVGFAPAVESVLSDFWGSAFFAAGV